VAATKECREKIEKLQNNTATSCKISDIINQIQKGGRREYVTIPLSTIDKQVLNVLRREKIEINAKEITLSTDRISHSIRPFKVTNEKALTKEDFIKLPFVIDECSIFFDHDHKNFWYIYEKNGKTLKYVFGNYKIKGKEKFTLITAGVIDERNLLQTEIEKIK
jgi:hypothetical protein